MPAAAAKLNGYFQITLATHLVASPGSSAGVTMATWTVPTGARFNIADVQAFCGYSGSNGLPAGRGRVNVLQGSTSVLSSEITLATGTSTAGTLTAGIVGVESAVVISATANVGDAGAISGPQNVSVRITGYLSRHPNSVFNNFGFADPASLPTFGQP